MLYSHLLRKGETQILGTIDRTFQVALGVEGTLFVAHLALQLFGRGTLSTTCGLFGTAIALTAALWRILHHRAVVILGEFYIMLSLQWQSRHGMVEVTRLAMRGGR